MVEAGKRIEVAGKMWEVVVAGKKGDIQSHDPRTKYTQSHW